MAIRNFDEDHTSNYWTYLTRIVPNQFNNQGQFNFDEITQYKNIIDYF